ncbi:FmdB family zinc ribbon protein [Alicyclobacillus vulcanalis]|uniref:Putative regulatory protein, FmdB family n=1 Tax=Alicyclobacillus vulcanalis TaxID=252246 RepID=A0A1N7K5R7_9BACL|nr:putative regulatory protein, FmdB family [Alicyclobacillus vulcanalis]
MPTYRFLCSTCGSFERVLPMQQAASAARCPYCGDMADRQFTAVYVGGGGRGASREGARSSTEPALRVRAHSSPERARQPHRHAGTGRPWQVGHVHG